jgi:lambda family phage portal protein
MAKRTRSRSTTSRRPSAAAKASKGKAVAKSAARRAARKPSRSASLSAFGHILRLVGSGGYSGARSDRASMQRWSPGAGSANSDTLGDIPILRGRSRDLARNAPLATGALNTRITSTVGTGLRAHAQIDRQFLQLDDLVADAFESDAERYFEAWTDQADVSGRLHWYDLQSLALRSHDESGDILVLRRFVERPGDLFGFRLQLVEADRVSNEQQKPDTATLTDGIECDADGRPVAFWIQTTHPGERLLTSDGNKWERIPAETPDGVWNALLIAKMLRPQQARGVPLLAPVIEALKQLDRYTEAEIAAAVISSLYTVFIKSDMGDEAGGPREAGVVDEGEDAAAAGADPKKQINLEPGLVVDLAPARRSRRQTPAGRTTSSTRSCRRSSARSASRSSCRSSS